jgi:predicted MFS family arabinose efflux permease
METAAAPPLAAPARMSRKLLFTLTATTALVVGNIYYAQPLLGEIAAAFGTSAASTGRIPTWGQLGYVAGLVLVTPLGDVLEKRRLLVGLLVLAGLALVGAGLAPTFPLLLAASAGIGVTAVLAQILIPFAATLSEPDERARNLGTVLSAALVGVFLSRTVSGAVGGALGWRAMFGIAGGAMFALALLLRLWLPRYEPEERLSYPRLLGSVWALFRGLPELRAIAITGALVYAALQVFWAALAFYLRDSFHAGPETAGLFGLLGAAGAFAANLAGRNLERVGARRLIRGCIALMLGAYAVFAAFGAGYAGLVVGLAFLDVGAQATTVSNQSEIYRIHPGAQTRLNTIYKIFYFVGGAAGSSSSALAWDFFGWSGVCAVGAAFLLAALLWEVRGVPAARRAAA